MPPAWKPKYCKVCGETDVSKLCITSVRNRKLEHRNLCKKCRQDNRRGTYTDWTNGKFCRHCKELKPISEFSVPSNPNCLVCGGLSAKKRGREKVAAFRKTEEGRKLRLKEEKSESSKARHKRYNESEKRKFAIANGLTNRAKAVCHPSRFSSKDGLCSACIRNKNTNELADSYIRQLIRKQYERCGLKAPKITNEMVEAERSIVIVRRIIKEMKSEITQ